MKDSIKVTGDIHAVLTNEQGQVIHESEVHNLVVTVGKTIIASRLVGTATNVISHMAVGTGGGTAPAVGQTALVSEIAGARIAISTGTASANVVTYTATFGPGVGTGSISECGLFNAASAGNMLARSNSVIVTKGASDTLALTWTVTIN